MGVSHWHIFNHTVCWHHFVHDTDDLFKCIYCGFCEEACPVDAIVETKIYEYHFEKKGENIIDKATLLKIGDQMESQLINEKYNN